MLVRVFKCWEFARLTSSDAFFPVNSPQNLEFEAEVAVAICDILKMLQVSILVYIVKYHVITRPSTPLHGFSLN